MDKSTRLVYLQLTGVKTVTEARYAAGEGFTHVSLDGALSRPETSSLRQAIREAMSGVLVGLPLSALNVEGESASLEGIDYLWEDVPSALGIHTPLPVLTIPILSQRITSIEEYKALMAEGVYLEGLSFESPGEDRPGWIAEAPFADLLEFLDDIDARPSL